MADRKISELTNITGANLANADEFVVVDTSADETKAITFDELKNALDTGTGFVRITGDIMTGTLGVPELDQGKITTYEDRQTTVSRSASDPSTQWVKLVTVDNPGMIKLIYRAGHTSAEERGEIELIHTYTGSNLHLTVNRQTYNSLVQTVRVTQVGANGTDYEIWVLMKNESSQPADPYISAQVYLAMTESKTGPARVSFNMATGTPSTAVAEIELGTDSNSDQRNTKAFTGFQRNYRGGVFNEGANDSDFRVESSGDTHMLFVDAGSNAVGVGTNNPNAALHVNDGPVMSSGWSRTMQLYATYPMIVMRSQSKYAAISHDSSSTNPITFWVNGSSDDIAANSVPAFKLGRATGSTILNDSGHDVDFRIESVPNTHNFFIEGATGYVGLGEPNPASNLHVSGSGSQGWFYLNNTNATADHVIYFRRQNSNIAYMGLLSTDQLWINGSAASKVAIQGKDATEVVFNESDLDVNFRVESENVSSMLFVDGEDDRVIIGSTSGNARFNVVSGSYPETNEILAEFSGGFAAGNHDQNRYVKLKNTYTGGSYESPAIVFESNANASNQKAYGIIHIKAGGAMSFANKAAGSAVAAGTNISATERFQLGTSVAVFNENDNNYDFRVEGESAAHLIFVDADANSVGINQNAPSSSYKLDVNGNMRLSGTAGTIRLEANDTSLIADQSIGRLEMYANDTSGNGTGVAGFIESIAIDQYGVNTALSFGVRQSGSSVAQERIRLQRQGHFIHSPIAGGHFEVNSSGVDADFKVQSDNQANAFFVDAADDHICIGGTDADPGNGNTNTGAGFRSVDSATAFMFSVSRTSGNACRFNRNTLAGDLINMSFDGSGVGSISVSSSGTIYNTTSDRRLKTDIQPISDGTEKLMQMQPVKHKWKANPDADAVHGFIAQDMQQIVAEAVSGEDGGDEMMSMDYGRITPVIVAALQDAHKKIEALEARLAELEV